MSRSQNKVDVLDDVVYNLRFMEDARRYDSMHTLTTLPVLIYQGRRDDVVDVPSVSEWAARQPRAILHLLDDGHQLLTSLDLMWTGTRTFLTEVA